MIIYIYDYIYIYYYIYYIYMIVIYYPIIWVVQSSTHFYSISVGIVGETPSTVQTWPVFTICGHHCSIQGYLETHFSRRSVKEILNN